MRSSRRPLRIPLLALALLTAGSVRAGEGRLELNHAKAVTGDESLGDAPGYPVTLKLAGAYVLTGPLTPPPKTSALEIAARGIDIDLHGQSIAGIATCTAGSCSSSSDSAIFMDPRLDGATIANGFVRGFGGDCLQLGRSSRVERLHIFDCGEDGIEVGAASDVRTSTVQRVGRHGIFFAEARGSYGENVISETALAQASGASVSGGSAVLGNACEDGRCSARAARRYYLTLGIFAGDAVLSACAPGFHTASALELRDTSNLEYALFLGDVETDSGRGPISNNSGWVRTGEAASSTSNCSGWTTDLSGPTGFRVILRPPSDWNLAGTQLSPWQSSAPASCSLPTNVWCIED
jgi:hypothetical protein